MIRSTLLTAVVSLVAAYAFAGCTSAVDDSSNSAAALDQCQHGAAQNCSRADGIAGTQACATGEKGYVWGQCVASACTGTEVACVTASGRAGVAACENQQVTSECAVVGSCHPGQVQPSNNPLCPPTTCTLMDGTWNPVPCNTPLVVAFSGTEVSFTRATGAFDLVGGDASVDTDWVSANTPWLVMDRNGNGQIDDGAELFGSMTAGPDGRRASNGFVALSALDDNADGRISPADAAFAALALWRDSDQNRTSSTDELVPLAAAGIVAIDLEYSTKPSCHDGSCEVERAAFRFRDASGVERSGEVVDVHLATRARTVANTATSTAPRELAICE